MLKWCQAIKKLVFFLAILDFVGQASQETRVAGPMGQTVFCILKFSKFYNLRRPKSFTLVLKLGSNTRHSNELLLEKSLKQEPNSMLGPPLRDISDNSIM